MQAINHHTIKPLSILLIILGCLTISKIQAQVGVGTTNPNATLDIEASNTSSPANNDGILIPRVDNFPSTNPTNDQDGMMVFVTGNGTPSKGFYFWDTTTTSWMSIQGISDSDWFEENTSSLPNSNTDDIFTNGFVGIGKSNVQFPLDISEDSSTRTFNLLNTNNSSSTTGIRNELIESSPSSNGSSNGIINVITRTNQTSVSGVSNSFANSEATNSFGYIYGYQNSFGGSTSNTTFAIINRFQGTTTTANGTVNLIGGPITNFYGVDNHNIPGGVLSGSFYGLYNSLTGVDNGDRYGVYTSFEETGFGDKYGEFISIPSSAGGNHFGVYADVQKTGSFAGYFIGRSSFGDNTTNRYELPANDGTNGQVMTTDGAGNLSFQDVNTDADWYESGTTTAPSGITSSIYTQGSVGIGNTNPNSSLDILYNGTNTNGVNLNYVYTGIPASTGTGLRIDAQATSANSIQGAVINVNNSSSSLSSFGVVSVTSANSNVNTGLRGIANGLGDTNIGVSGTAILANSNIAGDFDAALPADSNIGIRAYARNGSTTNWAGFFGFAGIANTGNVYVQDLLEVDGNFNFTDGNESNGYVLASNASGDASWTDPASLITDLDTQNTLDQAYDEGGAGAGRTVNVDSGSLELIGNGTNDFTTIVTNTNGKSGIELNVSGDISTGSGVAEQGIELNNSINTNASFANNYGIFNKMTVNGSAVNGDNTGFRTWFLPAGSSESNQYGFYTDNQNTGDGENYGFYNRITNDGDGTKYGLYSRITSGGSGDKYGIFSQIDVTSGGTHYGIYSVVPETNSFAGYFYGRVSLGSDVVNRYILPTVDGNSGQVMTTDGAGNISFQNAPTDSDWHEVGSTSPPDAINDDKYTGGNVAIGKNFVDSNSKLDIYSTNRTTTLNLDNISSISSPVVGISNRLSQTQSQIAINNILEGNTATKIATENNFSGTALSTAYSYGTINSFNTEGYNFQIGIRNAYLSGSNSGINSGVYNAFSSANYSGVLRGVYNTFSGNDTAQKYGLYNTYAGSGTGIFYGSFTIVSNSGSSDKYGHHVDIASTSGGTHYGFHADVQNLTGYAGYFIGRTSLGNTTSNRYLMPANDGTNGQVMTTDGSGNVTFQDPDTGTDDQILGFGGTTLSIEDGNSVNLASLDTDNQQIDTFSFNTSTNILTLEVEDDGQAAQTVDLSSLNPTKSIARIFMSTSQTETGAGTTKVNFDTVDFDTNGNYNLSTDEFDVPTDGLYRVTAQITLATNTGTGSFGVRVRVNGTQQRRSEFNHVGNGTLVRQVTSILNLTAGQTLDVSFVRPGTGATIEPNSRATFFEIEQL